MKIDPGFDSLTKFQDSLPHITKKQGVVFSGLCNISKSLFIRTLQKKLRCPVLIIAQGVKKQEEFFDDLDILTAPNTISFPAWEILPHERIPPHTTISAERLQVLHNLIHHDDQPFTIVAPLSALMQKVVKPHTLRNNMLVLNAKDTISFSFVIRQIFKLGYKRVDMVESAGEFSVRGGIIDVYSLSNDMPYRIEFWGDDIDTIRVFDPVSHLSQHTVEEVTIFPADEDQFYRDNKLISFMSYLPPSTLIIIDEPADMAKKLAQFAMFSSNDQQYFVTKTELFDQLKDFPHACVTNSSQSSQPFFQASHNVLFGTTPPNFLNTNPHDGTKQYNLLDERLAEINELVKDNYKVAFSFNNNGEKQRFIEICHDKNLDRLASCGSIIGHISGGFILPETQFAVISDQEIFGRYHIRRSSRKYKYSVPLREMIELNVGDMVVHTNYGIGLYQGIQKIEQDGTVKDMMVLEYARKAKLFVPLIHSNLVRRYIGCGTKETPRLDVLGTNSWIKKRKAVEEAVFDLAAEFLEIQAERKTLAGTAFEPDSPWQRE